MSGLWKVAMREIRERLKSKGYIASTVVAVLLVGGITIVPGLIGGDTTIYEVGSLGQGNDAVIEAANLLANATDEPDDEPSVQFNTTVFSSREEATEALREERVSAVLVDGTEIMVDGVEWSGPPQVVRLLQQGAAAVELERLIAEEGETAAEVIEVMTSDVLELTVINGEEPADPSRAVVAYVGLMLLYIAVLIYGTWILTGVTEEKTNRVVEVLLSTLRPWQLLGGKILGIGALGVLQFVITAGVALIAVRFSDFEIPPVDPLTVANLILWFILGFLTFAVLFGAAGSLASRMEDAQSVSFPMSIVAVGGLFVAFSTLDSPNGTAALLGTLFPLTSPFVVPVRVALDAIPGWQFLLAIGISILTIIGLTLVAGRVYAGGILRTGGKVRLREAWRGARE